MATINIKCNELIDEYKLDRNLIIEDLQRLEIKNEHPFPYSFSGNHLYSLVAKKGPGDEIILTNIIKAKSFREHDTSAVYKYIEEFKTKETKEIR